MDYKLVEPPPEPVGYYDIGGPPWGMYVAIYSRPNRFHRFMVRLILGWAWRDVKLAR